MAAEGAKLGGEVVVALAGRGQVVGEIFPHYSGKGDEFKMTLQ